LFGAVNCQRASTVGDRLLALSERRVGDAAVIESVGLLRIDLDRHGVVGNGALVLAFGVVGHAATGEGVGVLRIDLGRRSVVHAKGITDIETSQQAAEALRPVAGDFAFIIFSLGILGTGLLAVPVLAGSTAYAIGESRHWPVGLARKPGEAKAFYAVIAIATLVGMILNFTPINPIKALFWTAVLNGIVSVPVMVTMMLVVTNPKVMYKFVIKGPLLWFGWTATAVMTVSAMGTIVGAVLQ
jgi:Mn2+/Fe2+ NRAMP family transporter